RAVRADYYTEAIPKLRIRVVHAADADGAHGGIGDAHVVRTVPGFKKIRFDTHENVGFGPIHLPDLELHTRAAFWPMPGDVFTALDPVVRAGAAIGAAHAIHHGAALLLMCDAADLGHAITAGSPGSFVPTIVPWRGAGADTILAAGARPTIVLYDRVPGGAGLATTAFSLGAELFARVLAMVRGCACKAGCPTCLGPGLADASAPVDRDAVALVLDALRRTAGGAIA
ncbi:MAG TPA: DUF1998 domain-containing protein, partial [Nannocystaceae bacterium]|nr:DUF1998 domain-containing protein [Nannocystaceae bacterium]